MIKIDKKRIGITLMILLVALLVLAFFMLKPFISAMLFAFVLAYIFYPVHKLFVNKLRLNKTISALAVSFVIIVLMVVPTIFILYEISKEANVEYIVLKQNLLSGAMFNVQCESGAICNAVKKLREFFEQPDVKFYVNKERISAALERVITRFSENTYNFIFSLPRRLLEIFVTFSMTFFLLKDGVLLVKHIENLIPLNKESKDVLFKKMKDVISAVVYGTFLIALLEAALGALVLWMFGMHSPLIWGLIIGLLTFVPAVGAAIVWLPFALVSLYQGDITSAIGIGIGGLIISAIDTFLKPKIVGEKAAVHPALVFIGFVGGINLFGLVGAVIGPLVLVLTINFIKFYQGMK